MTSDGIVILKTRCGCWQEVRGYRDHPHRITVALRDDLHEAMFAPNRGHWNSLTQTMEHRVFERTEVDSHGRMIYVERG